MSPARPAQGREARQAHRAARPGARRRLRLDEGRQLAGGAARSRRRSSADVRAHLEAENAYTAAMLAATEPLQATMFEEMKGRIKEDDASVPSPDGPFDYYCRYETGAQHPIHARRPRGGGDGEEVLLDEDAEAKGKAYLPGRRRRPQPRPRPLRLGRGRAGLGGTTASWSRTWRPARCCPSRSRARTGDFAFSPDSRVAVLDLARRERPAGQGLPPARARRAATTCWSMRSRTTASSSASGVTASRRLHRHRRRQPGDQRGAADPGRRSRPPRPCVVEPRTRGRALRPRALGRPLRHPHQRRRRHRLQAGRRRRGRRPGPGALARLGRPPAGPL